MANNYSDRTVYPFIGLFYQVEETSIVIERASSEHLKEIEELERDCFSREAFSRRQIRYLIKSPSVTALVATLKGSVAGYIICVGRRDSSSGRIYTFCVRPEYRRKKIASRLLMELEKECLLKVINRLTLEVGEDNIAAYGFYNKNGFAELYKIPGYYSDGSTALKMEKFIKEAVLQD